jgi:hypothetical protein
MSDNKVQGINQLITMKVLLKSVLFCCFMAAIAVVASCNKESKLHSPDSLGQLINSQKFRNFVANDIMQNTQYILHDASVLKEGNFTAFLSGLSQSSAENLSGLFANYKIDFQQFQHHYASRLVNQMIILQSFPEIAQLPENQINQLFQNAYETIGKDIFKGVKLKANVNKLPMSGPIDNRYRNIYKSRVKQLGINTLNNTTNELYFAVEGNYNLSDEMAEEQIYSLLYIYATDHSITFGEAMNCLQNAIGWGGGTMGGIVGWSKAIAGIAIQEAVAVATRWALSHIGWLGLAVTTYTLVSCLVTAY